MADCVRSITFTIPGSLTSPGVEVYVEEQNGELVFTASILESGGKTADFRGLFFNLNGDSKLAGLTHSGSGGKVTDFDTVDVIDLGHGANMQGAHAPYDVGLEFGTQGIGKDDIKKVSFTLSNAANNLTLDDIAHVDFGARLTSVGNIGGPRNDSSKLTATAPAAPDARDDSYSIFEDGQSGLADPSKVSEGVKFEVLANDTDADGDTLSITHVEGAQHGIVTIIDGDDADLLPGDAVLYTPNLDYASTDSFTYCISDGNGGTDYADVSVNVEAVADVPLLTYEVLAGSSINEVILRVTATQNDADSSEFIDRIELSGVPGGVVVTPNGVNPGAELDQVVQDFTLTLPANQDVNFDLGITAVSKEVSNGDEESNSITVPIEIEFNANEYAPTFLATDQSIWDSGDQFTFTDDRFIGIDTEFSDSSGGFIGYDIDFKLKAGLQSTLTFEGGEIDASLEYDLGIDTTYNKTTDQLLIISSQQLTDGDFVTEGPEGHYLLDFVFDYLLDAALTYDILGFDGDLVSVGPLQDSIRENILDLDSSNLGVTIPFPPPFGSLSASLAWPNISTDANPTPPPPGEFSANGASNNFLQLDLDVDQALSDIFLSGGNPFDLGVDIGVVNASLELLDLDVFGGLNFLQSFVMQEQGLAGTLHFEDGTDQAFSFGNDILLSNASQKDVDHDGQVEFTLSLDAQADLHNDTDLGFNVGYSFDVLKGEVGYDFGIVSGSESFGPVFHDDGNAAVTTVGVYDDTFGLNFAAQDIFFAA